MQNFIYDFCSTLLGDYLKDRKHHVQSEDKLFSEAILSCVPQGSLMGCSFL